MPLLQAIAIAAAAGATFLAGMTLLMGHFVGTQPDPSLRQLEKQAIGPWLASASKNSASSLNGAGRGLNEAGEPKAAKHTATL